MKSDLVPKYLYYCTLFGYGLGLVFVGIVHQFTMTYAITSGDYLPFLFTSIFGTAIILLIVLIVNKGRYIVINPTDQNRFVMGSVLSSSHGRCDNLKIVKKVWINIFKVNVEERTYYIFSFAKTVDEFNFKFRSDSSPSYP